jgi:hypothetical protein
MPKPRRGAIFHRTEYRQSAETIAPRGDPHGSPLFSTLLESLEKTTEKYKCQGIPLTVPLQRGPEFPLPLFWCSCGDQLNICRLSICTVLNFPQIVISQFRRDGR